MSKYNARVLNVIPRGHLVVTLEGIIGRIVNEDLHVGDVLNVDIASLKTIEYRTGFWGVEFKKTDEYIQFDRHTWKKNYKIEDFSEESFTVKVDNKLNTIHKDFGVLFFKDKYNNINFYDHIQFSTEATKSDFDDFKKSIELGVCSKDIEIIFGYNFWNVPYETSLVKILSCHTKLNEDL